MKVLLVDFEATSVDPKTARILEIGAMVTNEFWDEPASGMSQLVWESGYPALTPEVERVTHITQDMLMSDGRTPFLAFDALECMLVEDRPDAVVAYNTAYDQQLFVSEMARLNLMDFPEVMRLTHIPWLCAMTDLEPNYEFKSWRLMHVALEYGVPVNPKELHRALADVELTRKMLHASGKSALDLFAFQQEPWVYVRAVTEKPWTDGGKSNDLAKGLGFTWQKAKGSDREFKNMWVKRIKERHLEALMQAPLKIVRLD